jgi:Outer membrane protein beta-barrel domain
MRFSLLCFAVSLCFVSSQAGLVTGFGAEGGLSLTYQKWGYSNALAGTEVMKDWDEHFNAGVFLQFFNYKYFNLDADIAYNQKGGLAKNGLEKTGIGPNGEIISEGYIDIWDRLDYISITPRAKFKYPLGKFEPFLTLGPSFDFLVKKNTSEFSPIGDANVNKYELSELYGVGVGYKIDSHFNCFFEFLHQPSLTYLYSNSNLDIRNQVLKFNVGMLYQL